MAPQACSGTLRNQSNFKKKEQKNTKLHISERSRLMWKYIPAILGVKLGRNNCNTNPQTEKHDNFETKKAPHKQKVAAYVEIYSGNFGGEDQ